VATRRVEAGSQAVAWGVVALGCLLRLGLAFHRSANQDEFQHLHDAWSVAAGLLPYRDFWDDHGPLTAVLLAPLAARLQGETLLVAARLAMVPLLLGILLATGAVAARLHGRHAAVWAMALLSAMDLFGQKMIEVRPDLPLVLLWLAALLVLLRAPGSPRAGFWSGLLLGAAAWASPKALFPLAASGLGLAACQAARGLRGLDRTDAPWRVAPALLAGFALPVALLLATFARLGAAGALYEWTIHRSFLYPERLRFSPLPILARPEHATFWVLAGIGWLRTLRSADARAGGPSLLLAAASLVLMGIHLFLLPAPYAQSAALFLPLLAVHAGFAVDGLLRPAATSGGVAGLGRVALALAAFAGAVLLPALRRGGSLELSLRPALHTQMEETRRLLALTGPHDAILSGKPWAITRPSPYFFGTLSVAMVELHRTGLLPPPGRPGIAASVLAAGCRFVVLDRFLAASLAPADRRLLAESFLPAPLALPSRPARGLPAGLLLAGRRFDGAALAAQELRFAWPIAGWFVFEVEGTAQALRLDGVPVTGPVRLEAGEHRLAFEGRPGAVILRARLRGE